MEFAHLEENVGTGVPELSFTVTFALWEIVKCMSFAFIHASSRCVCVP